MSKSVVFMCDACRKTRLEAEQVYQLEIRVDRRADAAGGMEDVVEQLDLCLQCCGSALSCQINDLNADKAQQWVKSHKREALPRARHGN